MPEIDRTRWVWALLVLAAAERATASVRWSPAPRRLVLRPTVAYRAGLDLDALPPAVRRPARRAADPSGSTRLPVAADGVQVGKFDVDRVVRLRSFYAGPRLTMRLQSGAGHLNGVSRSVTAARLVARHSPGLAPELVEHGTVGLRKVAYLVERTVQGRSPDQGAPVLEAIPALVTKLHRLHHGVGITHERLSALVHAELPRRWQALVDTGMVSAAVDAAVRELIARDALLEVRLGHGDLVGSNILRSGSEVMLIDWEYAGRQPIAFDLAKLHLAAGPAGPALDRLREGLGDDVGVAADHYPLPEQLALAHVQILSWQASRYARAAQAGRLPALERQTRLRLTAIEELLGLSG